MTVLIVVPIYAALFVSAFVLGIVALTKGRIGHGIGLIMASVIVPVVLAAVVATFALGTVALELNRPPASRSASKPIKTGPPVASGRQAKPKISSANALKQTSTPSRQLRLGDCLTQLESYGSSYKRASTSAQKEAVRARAIEAAKSMFANSIMTVSATLADVQIPKDGVAKITYKNLDMDDMVVDYG